MKDGLWTWWDNKGVITRTAGYAYDELHGERIRYAGGKKWELFTYEYGILDGPASRVASALQGGYEMSYKNGRRHGSYRSWYNRSRTSGRYQNGLKTGQWTSESGKGTEIPALTVTASLTALTSV